MLREKTTLRHVMECRAFDTPVNLSQAPAATFQALPSSFCRFVISDVLFHVDVLCQVNCINVIR